MNGSLRFALAMTLMTFTVISVAAADDWPQWRGLQRDGTITGVKLPATWPGELTERWRVEVGPGHSSPIIVQDRVFVITRDERDEIVRCLSTADGKERWQKRYASNPELDAAVGRYQRSPRATPLYHDGRIFTLGAGGILTAFDITDGKQRWQQRGEGRYRRPFPDFGAAASPLMWNNACVALLGGKEGGAIIGHDPATGQPKWHLPIDGPGYSSPIVVKVNGQEQLMVQTMTQVIGVSPAGKRLWSIPFETAYQQNAITPVMGGDLLIVSGYQQPLQAYRLADNKPVRVWQNEAHPLYMSTPVVHRGRLYGLSERNAGHYFCVDATTGKTLWKSPPRRGENASVQLAGDVLVFLNDTGRLTFAAAEDTAYRVLAEHTIAEEGVFAHPVLIGDRIYIKDQTHLVCFSWK